MNSLDPRSENPTRAAPGKLARATRLHRAGLRQRKPSMEEAPAGRRRKEGPSACVSVLIHSLAPRALSTCCVLLGLTPAAQAAASKVPSSLPSPGLQRRAGSGENHPPASDHELERSVKEWNRTQRKLRTQGSFPREGKGRAGGQRKVGRNEDQPNFPDPETAHPRAWEGCGEGAAAQGREEAGYVQAQGCPRGPVMQGSGEVQ